MSFEGRTVGLFSGEFSDGFVFTAEVAGGAGVDLGSHLGPSRPGLALDLAGDRLVLTAEAARAYPSESLLALEDVAGTLPPLRGAEIVANCVEGFGAGRKPLALRCEAALECDGNVDASGLRGSGRPGRRG
ncbi:MAG: hypothetical protein AAFQ81_02700 [Pseudomonadota bacterium]